MQKLERIICKWNNDEGAVCQLQSPLTVEGNGMTQDVSYISFDGENGEGSSRIRKAELRTSAARVLTFSSQAKTVNRVIFILIGYTFLEILHASRPRERFLPYRSQY
jgi:hypothetical protein